MNPVTASGVQTAVGYLSIARDIALIVASIWAFWRFRKERTYQAALEIGFNKTAVIVGEGCTTFLEITFSNRGKLLLKAKTAPVNGFAFNDGVEIVRYGGDLKIKCVDPQTSQAELYLDWFQSKALKDVCEINLLSEYENVQKGKRIDFWMEPGESYHLGVPLRLETGVYLAKVVFVGADEPEDFWSRIIAFEVKQDCLG